MGKLSEAAAASFEAIEHDLEQAWVRHPEVPESVRMQLAIAVAEVVGNIIEHGGAQHRPVRIEMQLTLSDIGQVRICFTIRSARWRGRVRWRPGWSPDE